MDGGSDEKRMRLRYAGACRVCGVELPAKAEAIYERTTKTVRCLSHDMGPQIEPVVDAVEPAIATIVDPVLVEVVAPATVAASEPPLADVVESGTPGASARREFERR
ncbi:hypothetical protein [Nostocoides sp. F2B08]|uniref:hypothetical protein n=1 Tax=Nostocoides sp. F2B08 TaxID=2653936 RepID=UPI003519F83B